MRSSTGSNARQNRTENRDIARAASRATAQMVEKLEDRRLMAVDPYDFRRTPVSAPSTADIANIKDGPLSKGGSALVGLYRGYTNFVKRGGDRYQFEAAQPEYNIRGRDVLMTVRTRGSVDALVAEVKELGGSVIYRSKARRFVEAYVPLNQVANLAGGEEILHMRPQLRPVLDSQGIVGNDAERSQKSEFVIPAFGVNGSGTKVGVISDSFDASINPSGFINPPPSYADDVASGDLPAGVAVLSDTPVGTNEGRAMLQLIHDIAPGADLAFHNVGDTQNTFASAIRALREDGADVIVDDVRFGDEPFFGEGIIDRAVNDVREDGAVYFSSQGNYGFAGYSGSTRWVAEKGGDELAVDFDGGKGVDNRLDIKLKRSGILTFQWDNAFDGSVANVTADVDVFLYRAGTLISSSVDDNFATGAPVERLVIPEGGNYELVIRLSSLAKGASAPTLYKFVTNDNDLFDSRKDVEYPGYNASTWGHSAASGNIPVGAVDNAASNAFGATRNLSSQDFSSSGPSVRIFDANGNRLPRAEVIQTPLVSGIQGTNTSVAGFAPFFGTSAAAPNVAAVAALLLDLDPTATPDDIENVLVESAKSNPLNGAKAGTYDPQSGYGLIDAVGAAFLLKPSVPISTIANPMRSTSGGVSSIVVGFSERVRGVDISDFILTRDGTSRNRFTGSETITSSNNGRTYTIGNLRGATSTLGVYTLRLRGSRTDIRDRDNNQAAGNVVSFDVSLRRPGNLVADTLDDGTIRLRWSDTSGSETSYRIQRSTDPGFGGKLFNTDVGANVTTFTDDEVVAGEVYYYRVRAARDGRYGDVASVATVASSAGEIFIDDRSADFDGAWANSGDSNAFLQTKARASATRVAEGDEAGQDANTATFASEDIAKGSYFIYTRYTAGSKNAKNATYEILRNGEVETSVVVDQTRRTGGWVLLGKFISESAGGLSVRLTSAGAKGTVTADAVRFLPADEATVEAYQAQKRAKRRAAAAASVID